MMTANVLDMYHGDNRERIPDFVALKNAGIVAVIHKASQGLHYRDPKYMERRAAAQAAGLLWGAYHYLDASNASDQANIFLSTCQFDLNDTPILLAADYEDNGANSASLGQLIEFMKVCEAAAVNNSIVIYSSNRIRETLKPHPGGHLASDMIGVHDYCKAHRLWLAEYGPHENVPWPWNEPITLNPQAPTPGPVPGVFLWQFSEAGHVNPIVGNVDLNVYDGTADQLAAHWQA